MSPRRRVAVIWINLGPYHIARVRAMREHFEVSAIELSAHQRQYGWKPEASEEILTLSDKSWEDTPALAVSLKLWRALTTSRPEAILVPGYSNLPAVTAAFWGLCHNRVNILMSDSNYEDRKRSAGLEFAKRLLVRLLFTKGMAAGVRSVRYLTRLGLPAKDISRKYDVVDNAAIARAVTEIRKGGRRPARDYFLCVARLAPEKDHFTLLAAWDRYRSRGGALVLRIVGHGPLEDEIRRRVAESPFSADIELAGARYGNDLLSEFAFASCLILPSVMEPWGLVVNEAMAAGLPVVTSQACGCSEDLVRQGENGFVFEARNAEQLAAIMRRIEDMPDSARAAMGERSKELIAAFTPADWASEVVRLLGNERVEASV